MAKVGEIYITIEDIEPYYSCATKEEYGSGKHLLNLDWGVVTGIPKGSLVRVMEGCKSPGIFNLEINGKIFPFMDKEFLKCYCRRLPNSKLTEAIYGP
jgi:hypothetical protein